jgi:hypothetical protein
MLHKVDALLKTDRLWGLPLYLNKRIEPVRWITKDYPIEEVNDIVTLLELTEDL